LLRQDEIVRSGRGGKGDPYKYSCSPERACSHLENESGNIKNSQKNDAKKDSCSLVPIACREQEKKITKTTVEPAQLIENACSHFPPNKKEAREQAFLVKNTIETDGQKIVSNEPIDLDVLGVEL
jgi:hypothetical protein